MAENNDLRNDIEVLIQRELKAFGHSLDLKLEQYKADCQLHIEQYRADNDENLEMSKATINAGQNAIKSMVVINGGAAVAMLAFIGNIWSTGKNLQGVKGLSWGLLFFVLGVLLSGIVSALTYLSQRAYAEHNNKTGNCINNVGICCGIFSFVCFLIGTAISFLTFYYTS